MTYTSRHGWLDADQRGLPQGTLGAPAREGGLAVGRGSDASRAELAKRLVDFAGTRKRSGHDRRVLFFDPAGFKFRAEDAMSLAVLGENDQAAGFAVEPMDDINLALEPAFDLEVERFPDVPPSRNGHAARGLADGDNAIVLEYDRGRFVRAGVHGPRIPSSRPPRQCPSIVKSLRRVYTTKE